MTALTGRLGLGTLHQTPELLRMRRALPTLLYDLNRLADLPSDPDLARTLTLYGRLTDRFGLLADSVYRPRNPDAPYARAWRTDRDAQLAAATGAEVVYGHLDAREDLYSNMMNELDTREDLKASVDILARLTAENGRLLMDLTRLMSIATQASATTRLARQTQAANVRRTAAYENKTLEELPRLALALAVLSVLGTAGCAHRGLTAPCSDYKAASFTPGAIPCDQPRPVVRPLHMVAVERGPSA